jgi:hypothetical protein
MKGIFLSFLFLILIVFSVEAQDADSLLAELELLVEEPAHEIMGTFKSTRVILGPSIERSKKNQLQFRVSHLFSSINSGYQNLYGLDNLVNMNLSFDYGISDRVQVGLSRSNKPDKTLMGNVKLSLVRQKTGNNTIPVSISYFSDIDWKTTHYSQPERNAYFVGRLDYVNMLLIGRKFNSRLSVQLSPSWIHRNLTESPLELNDLYLLGVSGRYMLNGHISINWEYFYTYPSEETIKIENNSLALGFDIETGGHVFQLYFSNGLALHPGKFLINQNPDFFDGNVQFGFSIMREFNLAKRKD